MIDEKVEQVGKPLVKYLHVNIHVKHIDRTMKSVPARGILTNRAPTLKPLFHEQIQQTALLFISKLTKYLYIDTLAKYPFLKYQKYSPSPANDNSSRVSRIVQSFRRNLILHPIASLVILASFSNSQTQPQLQTIYQSIAKTI